MTSVIKRDRSSSSNDLVAAIEKLIPLLKNQGEQDACDDLAAIVECLKKAKPGSAEHKDTIAKVIDAFEGDHELIAYTHSRASAGDQWTEAEELFNASARVLTLARRMQN